MTIGPFYGNINKMKDYNWIINNSGLPWLQLNIDIPAEDMLLEARNIADKFVSHRYEDISSKYSHTGWESVCIHGLGADKTNHYTSYGYNSNQEAPYHWTEIADVVPKTVQFFKDVFPHKSYYRVRFMKLRKNGFITPHTDMEASKLSPINISLNNPEGCEFKMADKGVVPFKDGTAFILDVSNLHAVINRGKEDRYHIIVHGNFNTDNWRELVEQSYEIYRQQQ